VLFPLISFPYITRVLGPVGFGKVQYVTTFLQYFTMIAALGIPIYGIREVAKARRVKEQLEKVVSELVFINIITSVLTLVVYWVLIFAIERLHQNETFYFVASLSLILSFCSVDWLFSGLEQFKFIAVRSLVIKVFSIILLFWLVKTEKDALIYLAISIFSTLLNNLWNVYSSKKFIRLRYFSFKLSKLHFKPLLYIFSTIAAISIYALMDTLILGYIKNDEAVGFYTAAGRINKVAIPILTALGTVLIPRISEAFKKGEFKKINELATYSLEYVLFIGIPITIGIIVLANEITLIFSGSKFLPSTFSMQLLAPTVLIIGLSNVWAIQILTPLGHDKLVTKSVVIGLVYSLTANLVLIPIYSYVGASFVNLTTELVVMACFAYYANKFSKVQMHLIPTLITITFTVIAFTFVKVVILKLYLSIYLSVLIIIISCAALYILFQFFVIKNRYLRDFVGSYLKKRLVK